VSNLSLSPRIVPGALITIRSGEWTSARVDVGTIIAVDKGMYESKRMLVYSPSDDISRLTWMEIDDFLMKYFVTIVWSPHDGAPL